MLALVMRTECFVEDIRQKVHWPVKDIAMDMNSICLSKATKSCIACITIHIQIMHIPRYIIENYLPGEFKL